MEWVETTAKTLEEAKDAALDELGIDHDEAEFVVVEEPRQGLFRQTRGVARVRARVAPRTPRAKTERRPRRGKSAGRRSEKSEPSSSTAGASDESGAAQDERPAAKRSSSKTAKSSDTSKKGGRGRSGSQASKKSSSEPKTEGNTMPMTLDQQVEAAEAFLSGLVEAFGVEGSVETTRTDDDNAELNVVGEDLGLLIGPRGQTINAIQELTRTSLLQKAGGSWEGHVHVDVCGYREQRRDALGRFVEKVAADVLESGTAKALEPMSASDRKAVHDTVNGIDGVHTTSEGVDPRRWVKIVPDEA